MSSSSKFIVFLFVASISRLSFAGEAILFNDPSLIGFRDGRAISGFYDSENEKFSCSFLFVEGGDRSSSVSVEGYVDTPLLTFVLGELSPEFQNRNKVFDIKGILYRRDSEWVIQTEVGQAGCENATGVFAFGPKDFRSVTYHVIREVPAIGIRIVKGKAAFYDNRDGKFVARKSYLVEGDGVIVMKNQGDFSYIRYVGAGPKFEGRVTFGWVRTRDLVNPFPRK
ncbi:hypothetical protein [Burkholderia sp. SCN-KJ]|uniref:hypothetical protein n=1 Tax=Burkholderia sp. SCN-KJ TaxID=2969248 RepID=UPI00214F742F|nr:hypothetical protein [Burkholderia sp. SCN-KJ]MCR4467490.1 hypothetical protein [Burkholderia sp. SCN-KJ]